MHQKLLLVSMVLLASTVGLVVGHMPAQEDAIKWLESYQQALRQARQTGKPIFLEFRCEA